MEHMQPMFRSQKITRILSNPTVHYRAHNSPPPPVPILGSTYSYLAVTCPQELNFVPSRLPPAAIAQEAGWASDPVWMLEEEKMSCSYRDFKPGPSNMQPSH
jgi:hypothetical protein